MVIPLFVWMELTLPLEFMRAVVPPRVVMLVVLPDLLTDAVLPFARVTVLEPPALVAPPVLEADVAPVRPAVALVRPVVVLVRPVVVLTPEVKQAIADEVKAELAAQQAAAQNPAAADAAPAADQLPAALDPAHRTFIVASTLSEQLPDGMECSLTQGDVLTRIDDTPDANNNVKVIVSGSQKSDCNAGAQVSVAVDDLQDMHNAFQENLEDGMQSLAKNQGKNGMPASPSTATTAGPGAGAQPDQDAVATLQKQQQDADAAEKDVAQANGPSGF